jgi:hypothetical protein
MSAHAPGRLSDVVPNPPLPERVSGVRTPIAIAAALALAVGAYFLPQLVRPAPAKLVGTCTPPTEYEVLHVVVHVRDGALLTECMYLGSVGTYSRTRR